MDLQGASGATYRFRSWSDVGRTPMAGNFVVLADEAGEVEMAGVVDDLSRADVLVGEAGLAVERLYIRLNVSRSTREGEHADLVARHAPAKVVGPGKS